MSSRTFTLSSGSGDRVIVVPETDPSIAGGRSLGSPASTESQSGSSAGSWKFVERSEYEPSEAAPRPRRSSSRRYQPEAPSVPTSRRPSRSTVEQEYRPSAHRSRSTRQYVRGESRRTTSDESTSTVASHDDFPHAYPGQATAREAYAFRQAAPGHGRQYPPPPPPASIGGGYDAFMPEALVHMPRDAFGYPAAGAFGSAQPNPFAPMGPAPQQPMNTAAYGYPEPMAPPQQRPMPMQRMSMYGYPSDMFHPQMMQGSYGMYPNPYMPHSISQPASPPPENTNAKEFEALKDMIKKHDEERLAWEKALVAKQEAEAAAKAAEIARAEEEKKKKAEIADASKAAKEAAEKKAADDAKKASEEAEKKLEEAKKAKEEAEKKTKELEEEKKKNAPNPDSSMEPIKFKDAAHRKFSFPWGVCKTWKGMEGLVKQAFAHIDVLGPHVLEGHYDLIGPDGEIILPIVWETTVQPGWEIEMVMWPIHELEPPRHHHAQDAVTADLLGDILGPGPVKKPNKARGVVRSNTRQKNRIVVPPAGPSNDPMVELAGMFPELVVVDGPKPKAANRKGKGKEMSGLARFFAGAPPAKKK